MCKENYPIKCKQYINRSLFGNKFINPTFQEQRYFKWGSSLYAIYFIIVDSYAYNQFVWNITHTFNTLNAFIWNYRLAIV